MSEAVKKDKNILYFIIYCIIVAMGWIIPPIEPITVGGMRLLGIFIAAVFGWTVTSSIWPSVLTMILIPFTGLTDLAGMISSAWGNDTVLFIVLLFVLIAFLEKAGVTSYVAAFLMTRKTLVGHPWRLIFMIFMVGWLLCSFCQVVPGMLITWRFIYKICNELGYKPYDKFANLLVFGVAVMGALSLSAVPWSNNALVILNSYMASSGTTINYLHYFAYSLPFGISAIIGYLVLCKFLFRLDVTKLKDFDPDVFDKKDLELTKERKIALIALFALILLVMLPSLLPADSFISIILGKMGLSMKAAFIILVLSLIRIDNKPIFNFGQMAKAGIPWEMMLMIMGIFCFTGLLGSPATGISALLTQIFTPMFDGVSAVVFFVMILAITVFLTNFMVNMIVAMIIISATLPIATTLGIDPLQVVYLITISCTIAFMLPPASAASAIMFANTEWVQAKDMYGYAFPTIILLSLLALFWNLVLFMF